MNYYYIEAKAYIARDGEHDYFKDKHFVKADTYEEAIEKLKAQKYTGSYDSLQFKNLTIE